MTVTAIRPFELAPVECPFWCNGHDAGLAVDDYYHMSDTDAVDLSGDVFADKSIPGKPPLVLNATVLVGAAQGADDEAAHVLLTLSRTTDGEDKLTANESASLASHLAEAADTIRANGDHLCWCDGMHRPGDDHYGEMRKVPLELHPETGREIIVWITREWKGKDTHVLLMGSDERHEVRMTPDEADQVAALLRRHTAHARGFRHRSGEQHPDHPDYAGGAR